MEDYTAEMIRDMAFSFCPQCGTAIVPNHKGRPRKFCSPECRSRWNNTHPKPENWKTVRSKICPVCGREFSYRHQYGLERKYCSRACANKGRWKEGSDSKESSLEKEEISSDNSPATDFVLVGYLCSGLALLFLLSGINLCFFFVAPNRTVLPALSRLSLSDSFCLLADFSAAVICQWLIFSAICLLIGTIGSSAYIVPAFLIGRALVSCFVCAFFSCALELFICRICHGKQACMITTFAVSLLVMYASGCLIPSAFLPDMLRRISATLPGIQLKNMIFWQFGQSVSSFDIIILIIEGILLIIAALLAGTFKKGKLTHSLRERSKYEEK